MAKTVKLIIAAAADKVADIIETLSAMDISATISTMGQSTAPVATVDDDDSGDDVMNRPLATAKRGSKVPAASTAKRKTGGNRGPVVYTPVGTQRQINAAMETLRKGTMAAYVFADVSKHPETSKREMIERLSARLAKAGLSTESIDNTVWSLQNRGLLKSVPVTE